MIEDLDTVVPFRDLPDRGLNKETSGQLQQVIDLLYQNMIINRLTLYRQSLTL